MTSARHKISNDADSLAFKLLSLVILIILKYFPIASGRLHINPYNLFHLQNFLAPQ